MSLINCMQCPNTGLLKLVPQMKDKFLCVSCYNLKQYEKGTEYVCNYCSMTCLRVHYQICCDSCHRILTNNYGIPKIDLANQHKFAHVLASMVKDSDLLPLDVEENKTHF